MKTGYTVADCMTTHPITVSKDTTIAECANIMREKHVGSLIVLENHNLVGIITEQDIVRKAVAEQKNPLATRAESVMEKEIITISPQKDIFEALTKMRDYNIRHVPVVDKEKLVGFLTIKDVLKIQPQLFELIAEKFELREEARKPVVSASDEINACSGCHNFSDDLEEVNGELACPSCRGEEVLAEEGEENFL